MSDAAAGGEPRKPLFERLATLLLRVPEDREQLLGVLRQAHDRSLLDDDALSMIEGVLQVSELAARDIMVSRAQMDVIDIAQPLEAFLPHVIQTAHSRFPVIDGNRDNVVGILHAKELLRLYAGDCADVRDLLRPVVFIPESKRLNVLLREFRVNRIHLAIVVDEYGGTAGLITIEDVLEQIVGDIEDEFDLEAQADNIVRVESAAGSERWRIRGITGIRQLNETCGTQFSDDEYDTVGGLVTEQLRRVPRRGEHVQTGGLRFEVLRANARRVQMLLVERVGQQASDQPAPGAH